MIFNWEFAIVFSFLPRFGLSSSTSLLRASDAMGEYAPVLKKNVNAKEATCHKREISRILKCKHCVRCIKLGPQGFRPFFHRLTTYLECRDDSWWWQRPHGRRRPDPVRPAGCRPPTGKTRRGCTPSPGTAPDLPRTRYRVSKTFQRHFVNTFGRLFDNKSAIYFDCNFLLKNIF